MSSAMPSSTDARGAKRAIDIASTSTASRDHPRAKRRDVDGAARARSDATACGAARRGERDVVDLARALALDDDARGTFPVDPSGRRR
ncbi:hypothetical protein BE221DRAFT_65633 [Ostreococcus tauri]|uniref:Uncharacterized protein n=1 Tax=Ostreococcus tauri TaxID=70448 RepID=A0A1Y5IM04_OSTTA|nr:hypothetical protein BE221DRAFT_65633 [Ostreococcus tauri]